MSTTSISIIINCPSLTDTVCVCVVKVLYSPVISSKVERFLLCSGSHYCEFCIFIFISHSLSVSVTVVQWTVKVEGLFY